VRQDSAESRRPWRIVDDYPNPSVDHRGINLSGLDGGIQAPVRCSDRRVIRADCCGLYGSSSPEERQVGHRVGMLRNHVLSVFERRPLAGIRKSEVQAWVRWLTEERELAPRTVRESFRIFSSIFKEAVEQRLIP
jgi:hypothetical protein